MSRDPVATQESVTYYMNGPLHYKLTWNFFQINYFY